MVVGPVITHTHTPIPGRCHSTDNRYSQTQTIMFITEDEDAEVCLIFIRQRDEGDGNPNKPVKCLEAVHIWTLICNSQFKMCMHSDLDIKIPFMINHI